MTIALTPWALFGLFSAGLTIGVATGYALCGWHVREALRPKEVRRARE